MDRVATMTHGGRAMLAYRCRGEDEPLVASRDWFKPPGFINK
jgi:hypothetical protein